MNSTIPTNAFHQLRAERMLEAKRPFNARGKLLKRCPSCQIGLELCICQYKVQSQLDIEFALLMHRDEILKPTNTGRLIADLFPQQTYAFCWHRTEPPQALLDLLADESRQCFIVFPAEPSEERQVYKSLPPLNGKTPCFILLDGTWKQGRRMMQLSRWLSKVPAFTFNVEKQAQYSVRKAKHEHQVSTAEAASLLLNELGDTKHSALLHDYFSVFNQHYAATRISLTPSETIHHQNLLQWVKT